VSGNGGASMDEEKKLPLEGEHDESNDSHSGGDCCGKCEVKSHILLRKVEVEHFIREMTHKPNTLLKCGVQLTFIVVLKLNVDDPWLPSRTQ
jgi:hypothetical protein